MMRPLFAALLILLAPPASAQGFNLGRSDSQIQVYADNGIEWHSDALRVIASGNAKAERGTVSVYADTLTAHYRKGKSGDEIWRLDADGHVRIVTATETATGDKAIYDLDKAIFVLKGSPVAKLVTPTETFTATESLEYWEMKKMAVARGDAVAIQADKRLQSDVITGHFRDNAKGAMQMSRADAFGNVKLTTPKETLTGDKGDYNTESGIATVSGSVTIARDGNVLNGGYAHVNLNTGVSKLFGSAPGAKDQNRVQGVFHPDRKDVDQRRSVFRGAGPSPPKEDGTAGGQ